MENFYSSEPVICKGGTEPAEAQTDKESIFDKATSLQHTPALENHIYPQLTNQLSTNQPTINPAPVLDKV